MSSSRTRRFMKSAPSSPPERLFVWLLLICGAWMIVQWSMLVLDVDDSQKQQVHKPVSSFINHHHDHHDDDHHLLHTNSSSSSVMIPLLTDNRHDSNMATARIKTKNKTRNAAIHHRRHHDDDEDVSALQKIPSVAIVISITECVPTVVDGAAVLMESVLQTTMNTTSSSSSTTQKVDEKYHKHKYQYDFIALVLRDTHSHRHDDGHDNKTKKSDDHRHADATTTTTTSRMSYCTTALQILGYTIVLYDELPFRMEDLMARTALQKGLGCCGMAEYLKLYAYTLTNYQVVIHLDVDVIVLQSLHPLIDTILKSYPDKDENKQTNGSPMINHNHAKINNNTLNKSTIIRNHTSKPLLYTIPASHRIPDKVDFIFTRDYNTVNRREPTNRLKNGVQGAFFVIQPNQTRFEDLLHTLKTTSFDSIAGGWNRSGFGGYWGAAQIQGLFSYYYYLHPETTVELNPCRYNTLGTDLRYLPITKSTKNESTTKVCRTGEASCDDCSTTPWEDIVLGHLSSCLKPWWCKHAIWLKTPTCRALTQRWFQLRTAVQQKLQLILPSMNITNRTELEKRFIKKTFGFCQGEGQDNYVPLQLLPS